MNPERWRQIEQLYHAALEHDPPLRAGFLSDACQGDDQLRQEIEALIAQEECGSVGPLDRPAWENHGSLLDEPAAPELAAGTELESYRIEAVLAVGGMGRVYKGRDMRLDRPVAIKVLAKQFSTRFQREARAISALNHPHICTLYDIGPDYLVMELVQGETLARRLNEGPLPMNLVLRWGEQLADALAAAHAKGIVHRDLKPDNIMVTNAGLKVLDFGLAKCALPAGAPETLTTDHAVVGTPAYMAPEQMAGMECDARTDIFALGLVLYEMATANRLQVPHGVQDGLSISAFPDPFAHVLERCLKRDPEERWQSARDVRAELEWAGKSRLFMQTTAGKSSPRWVWGVAGLVCASLLSFAVPALRRRELPVTEPRARFILSFEQQTAGFPKEMPVPSPDGRYFVFAGTDAQRGQSLWIRPLDSDEVRPISGTEGGREPFWSPDGQWIGFYAGGKLKKVSRSGGPAHTIAHLPGFQHAAWGKDGDIIYVPGFRSPLFHIRESGGSLKQLTQLERSRTENSHRSPVFLPDGRRFLYATRCEQREHNALYIGSLDSPAVRRLMPVQSYVRYTFRHADGLAMLLFYRDGSLFAQQFDADREELIGNPLRLMDNVDYDKGLVKAFFETSADGRIIIVSAAGTSDSRLTWFDRGGRQAGVVAVPGEFMQPRLSPRGDRVAFTRPDDETGNRDVWYIEIKRGVAARLTAHPANDWFPVWSPDGRQLLFGSSRGGGPELRSYLKTSMDAGVGESLLTSFIEAPLDWSRDGKWISYGDGDLWVASAAGDRNPFSFLATPFIETGGRFSPDGKWIAYASNETGRFEIYVRRFEGGRAAAGRKIQISHNGGDFPVWRADGPELFYMSGEFDIHAVDTRQLGQSAVPHLASRLFRACAGTVPMCRPMTGETFVAPYDTHDGRRFLINCRVEPPGRFVVLTNWTPEPR